MKPLSLIMVYTIMINCSPVYTQVRWPFSNPNQQATVTGSIGEYRNTGSISRFHKGVDLTNGQDHSVYAIESGDVTFSNANNNWSAEGSYVLIGSLFYYHIKPKAGIINGTVTNIQKGDYIGEMIVESGWPTHLHLQEASTNYLNHRLSPYIDMSVPDFRTTFIKNGVQFYRNGLLKSTSNYETLLLNKIQKIKGKDHIILYNKIDIVAHVVDQRNNSNGSGIGGQLAPFEISWMVKNLNDQITAKDWLRFDAVPDNAAAPASFHPKSVGPGNPSIHIITSNPTESPYDRYWNSNLKNGKEENWADDNTLDANHIQQARTPDGTYVVEINAYDVDYNSNPKNNSSQKSIDILIDNFRPYIEKLQVSETNDFSNLVYEGKWTGNDAGLTFSSKTPADAQKEKDLWIKIYASEPMKNVQLSAFGLDQKMEPVSNTQEKEWTVKIPATSVSTGVHKIIISSSSKDLAGNKLEGFGSIGSVTSGEIPKHQSNGTWSPTPKENNDGVHEIEIGDFDIVIETADLTSCKESNGKATISVKNETGDLEYAIDGGGFQVSNQFDNLASGNHNIKVRSKDKQRESAKDFIIIDATEKLTLAISGLGTSQFCNNANPPTITLTATASGGSGNYDYTWPGGTIKVTSSGRQSVTATDKETGCKTSLGGDVIFVPVICSRDPNDIIGPDGYGPAKMIAKSKQHSYMIRFENDPDFATAPAQIVKINHPLDSNVNIFSLRLGDFGFGGLTFIVPPDKTFYSTRLNVLDSLGIVVDVTAGIDVAKREAFWIFESKDPATGLPPENPQLGFLPVNDSSSKGEGFVTYTVKAAANTKTGDSIHAKASIIFDINSPIETPVIFNTIDAAAPTSLVGDLPAISDSTDIAIKWSGYDDPGGSGIRDYSLYVSENGDVFSAYQTGIADTITTFTGSPGNTYSFYTLAIDSTGNTEPSKTIGDQTIFIRGGIQTVFYHDADTDGYGNPSDTVHALTAPPGYITDSSDCNDSNAAVHPGATEICNGLDDNCDGQIDEGVQSVFYHDSDNDGYGNVSDTLNACTPPAGYVEDSTDCDDTKVTYADNDGDGFGAGAKTPCGVADSTDCNDSDSTVHSLHTYFKDADGDGFGNLNNATTICSSTPPASFVEDSTDCDDTKITYADNDGDGFGAGAKTPCGVADSTDCNDNDSTVHSLHTYFKDADGDGFGDLNNATTICSSTPPASFVEDSTDCDDTKITYADNDGDGFGAGAKTPCGVADSTDCNDNDSTVHFIQTYYKDEDGDGHASETMLSCSSPGVGWTLTPLPVDDCNDNDPAPCGNTPPAVSIVSPVNNQIFLKGATIHLQAVAGDSNGSIAKVEFYNDTTVLGTVTTLPYSFDWRIGRSGHYSITAKATDNQGAATTSAAVNILVVPNKPPSVSIINPGNGDNFTAPATINFEVAAHDTDGRVAQVRLYNGTTLLANEYKLPYTYQWKNVPAGTYSITAVAKDNWSAETTSAPITITVSPSPGEALARNSRPLINSKSVINNPATLNLVPNPAHNVLNVYTTGLPENKKMVVSVISASGLVMKRMKLTGATKLVRLNISSFANGVYIIKIESDDKVMYKQFVKF